MLNTDQLLKENLIEALKQVHQYVVLGLGTSASALALAVKTGPVGPQANVTVPGTFVAVDPQAARAVLLAICFIAGAMAYYSADAANLIAQRLKTSPELLRAACTYPSFATSRFPGVRYVAALLPLLLSVVALLISALHETPRPWSALWIGLVLIGSAYISLASELHNPHWRGLDHVMLCDERSRNWAVRRQVDEKRPTRRSATPDSPEVLFGEMWRDGASLALRSPRSRFLARVTSEGSGAV